MGILEDTGFFNPFNSSETSVVFARQLDLPLREKRLNYGNKEDLEAFLSEDIELSDLDLVEWDSSKKKITLENMDQVTKRLKNKIKESRNALFSIENFLKDAKVQVSVTERTQKAHDHLNRIEKELETLIAELYSEANQPDPNWICPITQQIMEQPYQDPYGHNYDYEAIKKWLETHTTSPLNRQPLSLEELQPNHELLEKIQKYNEKQNLLLKRTLEHGAVPPAKKQKR